MKLFERVIEQRLRSHLQQPLCEVCLPTFRKKKPNIQNGQKGRENRTNMDTILLILAKPLDKNVTALVQITYEGGKGGGTRKK